MLRLSKRGKKYAAIIYPTVKVEKPFLKVQQFHTILFNPILTNKNNDLYIQNTVCTSDTYGLKWNTQ